MRIFWAIALSLIVSSASLAGDPTSPFAKDDPVMNRAIKQAKKTLPAFLGYLQENPSQLRVASLKVALQGTDYVEHIWVNNLRDIESDTIRGTLNNNPNNLAGMSLGSPVTFSKSSVSDWSIYHNGKGYGSYTLRVIAKKLKGADKAALEDYLSTKPLPDLW